MGKTVAALHQERRDLRDRLKVIDRELAQSRCPEWNKGHPRRSAFDEWTIHEGIEIMTPEADAAYEGWCAARENWARNLHPSTRADLINGEYTHWGDTGYLEIWYTLNGKDTIKEKVMEFSEWKLRPKDFHQPRDKDLRKMLFCQGTLVDTEGTRRFLGFLQRYWGAHHEDRPRFDDMLFLTIEHGGETYYKGMRRDTVPPAPKDILQRFEQGRQEGAHFSFWFRDWYDAL
jgi:hypothetical protein